MTSRWLELQRDPDGFFETLLAMTARSLTVPAAVISIITAERYVIRFAHGLPPEKRAPLELPMINSPCRDVSRMGRKLVINDVLANHAVRTSPLVTDLGIAAYLGEPLHDEQGTSVGAFCVFEGKARDWSEADQRMLSMSAVLAERALNWPDGLDLFPV